MYRTPLAVQPQVELRPTPDNYRETYAGPGPLPDQIKVWKVQNSPKGSALAEAQGFLDSPDVEILAVGFNLAKHYGDIGIGRQGNFLQWGYGDPPSQMTEAGRRLFLNCIHYIARFEGQIPLVRVRSDDRRRVLTFAGSLAVVSGRNKERLEGFFPKDLWQKYQADAHGMAAYYRENLELVWRDDGAYQVDEELRALGLGSNRKIETLQRLIALLDDGAKAAAAQKLLARYTVISFQTPAQWQQWFAANKDRIYFTDVGGYKFLALPQGYLSH